MNDRKQLEPPTVQLVKVAEMDLTPVKESGCRGKISSFTRAFLITTAAHCVSRLCIFLVFVVSKK